MIRFSWLALIALLISFVAFGCAAADDNEYGADDSNVTNDVDNGDSNGDDESDGSEGDDTSSIDVDMTLASNAYTNDDGVALCPVRDNPIEDVSTASSQEYEDKTYYFC
ncbi:MAG: hypothetical protein IH944_01255 [Armatimonadetes bacterium]|nr:hypothetical protein [Armatimonadota bacterium]